MDDVSKVMVGTVIFAVLVIFGLTACSVVSVQIVGGDGTVNKVVDPADRSINLMDRPWEDRNESYYRSH